MRPLKKYNVKKKNNFSQTVKEKHKLIWCMHTIFCKILSMISSQPPLAQITSPFSTHSQLYAMTLAQKRFKNFSKKEASAILQKTAVEVTIARIYKEQPTLHQICLLTSALNHQYYLLLSD